VVEGLSVIQFADDTIIFMGHFLNEQAKSEVLAILMHHREVSNKD
jgi:hypothetical protein